MKIFNAMKIFMEIHRDNHLNMMINEVIGRVKSVILENQNEVVTYF